MAKLIVDGGEEPLGTAAEMSLLSLVSRHGFRMTATKSGVRAEVCGALTVHVDGQPARTMRSVATSVPGIRWASRRGLMARLPDFIALTKPRVMMLAVFTAFAGLASAPRELDALHAFVAVIAIAAGAGAAGVLNMWYDADIDAVMTRTAMRPIPRGKVSPVEALVFGLALAAGAILVLALATNLAAAALLGGTILFYAVVYTAWLKRWTRHNIVIGGAAGALPPVIGWTAATGDIGVEPFVLFLIIFLWTPPHFWALALNRADDYARAGIPMLPVVSGSAATKRQILIYSVLLVAASLLPWALGFAGAIYGATAAVCGAILVALAYQLGRSREGDRRAAHRLFAFSISYLFVLFAVILVNHGGSPWPSVLASRRAGAAAGFVHVDRMSASDQRGQHSVGDRASEV